ncbi:MAG: hypothetical protein Kow0010_16690 [Dehalococcoidia bacterium]
MQMAESPTNEHEGGAGPRRKGRLSRRRLLQGVGATAVIGAAVGAAPLYLAGASAQRSVPTRSRAAHQWGMVIDLRKCEGCVTAGDPPVCTESCNLEHSVPPGQEWIRVVQMEMEEAGHTYFLPLLCQQCEQAPCVNVCPVGATYATAEGVVLIDHEKCIGCRMCMAACPYGARSFNWEQPPNPPEATFGSYSPEYPVPHRRGTVNKCMLCAHLVKDGKLPACAKGCPMFAIYLADLAADLATNGREVVQFSRFIAENSAFRLREGLGTGPRVWYIPGYGQESGRKLGDETPVLPARTWIELRQVEKEPGEGGEAAGRDAEDDDADHGGEQ